jgi:hypothetical protein
MWRCEQLPTSSADDRVLAELDVPFKPTRVIGRGSLSSCPLNVRSVLSPQLPESQVESLNSSASFASPIEELRRSEQKPHEPVHEQLMPTQPRQYIARPLK